MTGLPATRARPVADDGSKPSDRASGIKTASPQTRRFTTNGLIEPDCKIASFFFCASPEFSRFRVGYGAQKRSVPSRNGAIPLAPGGGHSTQLCEPDEPAVPDEPVEVPLRLPPPERADAPPP